MLGIKCSALHVDGKPVMVTMDYKMDVASLFPEHGKDLVQGRLVYHFLCLGTETEGFKLTKYKYNYFDFIFS